MNPRPPGLRARSSASSSAFAGEAPRFAALAAARAGA